MCLMAFVLSKVTRVYSSAGHTRLAMIVSSACAGTAAMNAAAMQSAFR